VFGIDHVVVVFAASTALHLAIEIAAELMADRILNPPGPVLAEMECLSSVSDVCAPVLHRVDSFTLMECIEACPTMLGLAGF